jgi:hypothetical protein
MKTNKGNLTIRTLTACGFLFGGLFCLSAWIGLTSLGEIRASAIGNRLSVFRRR